jgi:diguanylate cyclase (GGDEF)-like protein
MAQVSHDMLARSTGETPRGETAGSPRYFLSLGTGTVIVGAAIYLLASLPSLAGLAAAVGLLLVVTATLRGWQKARRMTDELATTHHELRIRSGTDPLTGLLNRGAFNTELERCEGLYEDVLIVLFFDLNRFKDVNDTFGHRAGDDLLIQVAERARRAIGPEPVMARLGGDEFAALIAWHSDRTPQDYARDIVTAVAAPFVIDGQCVEVGASVGIAVGDPSKMAGSELLRRADLAMYAAKGSPDIKWRLFDDALDRRETRDSSVRVELGKAMIENAFSLHFQPLVKARTGRFESAEALLRSQSAALRDVPPATLISIAEASGQIHALTEWTLDSALSAVHALGDAPIAVNISPIYFRKADFVHRLMDKLLVTQTRPELLILEVTEGVLIENLEVTRHSLGRLREIGVRIFLDDFGTGYSSLSYLQNFELDGLKLDKSFLRSAGDRRKANQIIRSMIDFGHSLDMSVVVEGVECDWQVRLLQLLGADLLQGYEIGMPMALTELAAFRTSNLNQAPDVDLVDERMLKLVSGAG